ncbi:MAG TPA: hypothetical protein VGR28_05545 [Candidatus Thermoplasmatota archaeon]|jgi:hypothetical protein|nr:hypothetical protein [Candidatus Thermoplasmatota archaeon]
MRARPLAVLPLLLLPAAAALGPLDGNEGETCTLVLVCADAVASATATCGGGTDYVYCEFVFLGTTAGRSPVLLPGRATSSLDAILQWHCEPLGCEAGEIDRNVNVLVTWSGGPELAALGMEPGASYTHELLRETIGLVSDGTPACLVYSLSQESTVFARVPHVSGSSALAVVQAVDGDGDVHDGSACTT